MSRGKAGGAGTEIIPLRPVDSLTVTSLVDNSIDVTAPDEGPAGRRAFGRATLPAPTIVDRRVPEPLVAEHGFSVLVEATIGGTTRRLLFDTGISPTGVVENARRLDLDLGMAEAIVLSHGHYDHTTGMAGLVDTLGRANLPVVVHPGVWSRRRISIPGREPRDLPTTSAAALGDAGFAVVESRRPSLLLDGAVLVTGEVDRTAPFETGFPGHEALREGTWEPDPDILDDQALVMTVRGEGLVVITGCGHAGVVNILRQARLLTGTDRVLALIGGFHLGGTAFGDRIPATVEALASMGPRYLVPAHCTGFRARVALAQAMPDAVLPNTVGTTYRFLGAAAPTAR